MVIAMVRAVSIGKVVRYRDRWRIDLGRQIERAIGARYIYGWGPATSFTNRRVANLVLLRMRSEIAKGGRKPEDVALDFLPAGQHSQVLPRMRKWLEQLQAKAESGDRSGNYTREIERWVGEGGYFDWWRGRSLYAIDEATIEDFGDWLAEQKIAKGARKGESLSGKTRRNIMAAFHSFYAWASRRDRRVRALTWFPWPPVDEPDVQVVSLEERDSVLAAIAERKRGVFLAMRLGAPRPNMAMEILANDYDRKTQMLSLNRARKGRTADSPIGSTKTRVAWTIPVDQELADWIEEWVRKEAFLQGRLLFENPDATNRRKAWTESRLRTTWQKASKKALGRHVGMYAALKHCFATNAIAGGGAESDLKSYLGHKDAKSTRRYVLAAQQRYGSIQSLGIEGRKRKRRS